MYVLLGMIKYKPETLTNSMNGAAAINHSNLLLILWSVVKANSIGFTFKVVIYCEVGKQTKRKCFLFPAKNAIYTIV